MFIIQNTLVSEEIFEKNFVCHLDKCKGACCVEGDQGAPLAVEEIDLIAKDLDKIRPFMSSEGLEELDKRGFYETDPDGDLVTTCRSSGECTFVVYENGSAQCAIEKAWKAGETDFVKPISCHLYPVRVGEYGEYRAVNYHQWEICSNACSLGDELKVPVYKFLKTSLIRKFGNEWYEELDEIATAYQASKQA